MTDGILGWKALTRYGVLLCLFGFFGAEFDLWGKSVFVWAMCAGILLFVGGLGMGAILAATGGQSTDGANDEEPGGGRHRRVADGDIDAASAVAAAGAAAIAGPLVNVDGTPMLGDGMFDVLGRVFGDIGTSFSDDFGGSFSSDMDSSGMGSSDW